MNSPDSQMGQPLTNYWLPVPEGCPSISTGREPGVSGNTSRKTQSSGTPLTRNTNT